MANYFNLILDTMGPNITIYAPAYTVSEEVTEIFVQGSEQLGSYQDIYLIGPYGQRIDLTFEHLGDRFRGTYNFSAIPLGIYTIYARVKDALDNPSPLASRTIYLREKAPLRLATRMKTMSLDFDMDVRKVKVSAI